MDPSAIPSAAAGGGSESIFMMFWSASFVVKLVMLGLLGASVWCWSIIVDKKMLLGRVQKTMDRFEQIFWSGESLEELYSTLAPRKTAGMETLFISAMREWKRSFQAPTSAVMGLHARIEKVLDVSIAREVEGLERNMLVLASVASAGPFVGLFGTVWGIMSSFQSIAASKNTSLAVVAPGIAEALLATALGLFAAIPALIAYNALQGSIAKAQARMETFADEFSAILSRQIDQHIAADRGRAA
ncbi:MAG: protein TolQ [Hyphomicrobiales bacterium]|nr:protein TolQ [Hyphomicrobiales bacterium]MDE2018643.1 protein TolQ [Hyphomicrobiales bacterium]